MAGKIDTLLKLSVIASLLAGSAGVGYYYALYLPRRDAERDAARLSEQLRAYGERRVEEARVLAEQQQSAQRREADKASAEGRYQTCLSRAGAAHDASWSAACKRLAEQAVQDRAGCLAKSKLPEGYCNAAYRARDASPNCVLPLEISTALDGELTTTRNRCLQLRNAALQ